jgi:DNA topoisomerase-2
LIKGCYERTGPDSVVITELPVGKWTMAYTKMLEEMMDGSVDKSGKKIPATIKDFTSLCTEVSVHFIVNFPKGALEDILSDQKDPDIDGVEKLLKLSTTIKTSNIHMFDENSKLKKFDDVDDLILTYYPVRLAAYQKRKDYLVAAMKQKMLVLSNKARYIEYNLIDKVDLRRKTAAAVDAMLESYQFDRVDNEYKYLTKMPMDSVTVENVDKLRKERDDTQRELEILIATTLEQMWLHELDVFETAYDMYKKERVELQLVVEEKPQQKKKATKK